MSEILKIEIVEEDGLQYKLTTYVNGMTEKRLLSDAEDTKPAAPELTPEQEQLNRIEAAVMKRNEDIAADAIAAYEAELNAAYTEGVNSL